MQFKIRDLLWLMVVVGVASGWYTQSLRWKVVREQLLSHQAAQRAELKTAQDHNASTENVLYNEHLEHLRTTRDLSNIIIDILTSEQAFAANRKRYLEPVTGQRDLAVHMFDHYDAARPSTVEQIKRLAKVRED